MATLLSESKQRLNQIAKISQSDEITSFCWLVGYGLSLFFFRFWHNENENHGCTHAHTHAHTNCSPNCHISFLFWLLSLDLSYFLCATSSFCRSLPVPLLNAERDDRMKGTEQGKQTKPKYSIKCYFRLYFYSHFYSFSFCYCFFLVCNIYFWPYAAYFHAFRMETCAL